MVRYFPPRFDEGAVRRSRRALARAGHANQHYEGFGMVSFMQTGFRIPLTIGDLAVEQTSTRTDTG